MKTRKIVISASHRGFDLSDKALEYMGIKTEDGIVSRYSTVQSLRRDDKKLVTCVEKLGEEAGYNLKVVKIPADVDWQIQEYDGLEWVAEKHRTWE